jgi:7-carboxy-7-deazaguanine synthase
MNMTAQIVEIFRSIQGEGPYAGVRQVFVRFYGCNTACAWCDTPAARADSGIPVEEMTGAQLTNEVVSLWDRCHSVSLTGGEPLLQAAFLRTWLPALRGKQMPVYLETNGICDDALAQVIDDIAIVSMDIKLPSSTKAAAYWDEHQRFLTIASSKKVFVKMVVSASTHEADIRRATDIVAAVSSKITVIMQPDWHDSSGMALQKCLAYQEFCLTALSDVRVLPQIHRYLNIR